MCAGTPAALNINHLVWGAYPVDVLVVDSILGLKLDNVHDEYTGRIRLPLSDPFLKHKVRGETRQGKRLALICLQVAYSQLFCSFMVGLRE